MTAGQRGQPNTYGVDKGNDEIVIMATLLFDFEPSDWHATRNVILAKEAPHRRGAANTPAQIRRFCYVDGVDILYTCNSSRNVLVALAQRKFV